jgi:ribosomal protein S18 acetylase RimI-like enzyme
MEYTKFDIIRHDLEKVTDLIFETEPHLFSLLFGKNKTKAFNRIKKIIRVGKNTFGHENIYLAIEDDQILGLTIIIKGNEIDSKIESEKFSEALDFFGLIRLIFIEKFLLDRLLKTVLEKNDLYVNNVCVDKDHRGKGVGKFLMNNILIIAKSKHCNRILLDVSKDNIAAIALYKKIGFKKNIERSSKFWKFSVINMIKEL